LREEDYYWSSLRNAELYWCRLFIDAVKGGMERRMTRFSVRAGNSEQMAFIHFHKDIMKKMPLIMKCPDIRNSMRIFPHVCMKVSDKGILVYSEADLSIVSLVIKRAIRIIVDEKRTPEQKRNDTLKNKIRKQVIKAGCAEARVDVLSGQKGLVASIEISEDLIINKRLPTSMNIFAENAVEAIKKLEMLLSKFKK
jgi:hypothetical protein